MQASYVGGTRGFTDNGPPEISAGGGGVADERQGNLSAQFMPQQPPQQSPAQSQQGLIGQQDNRHASSSFNSGAGINSRSSPNHLSLFNFPSRLSFRSVSLLASFSFDPPSSFSRASLYITVLPLLKSFIDPGDFSVAWLCTHLLIHFVFVIVLGARCVSYEKCSVGSMPRLAFQSLYDFVVKIACAVIYVAKFCYDIIKLFLNLTELLPEYSRFGYSKI